MKIYALEPNSTKFCIHNQWAPKRLKIQKLTFQNRVGKKYENLCPLTKFNQICIHNQWAPKRLKIQKLTFQNGEGKNMKIYALEPNSTKFVYIISGSPKDQKCKN